MGLLGFEGVRIDYAPDEAVPRCPKCEADLDTLWLKTKGAGIFSQMQIVMCPHCRTLLGFSKSG